MKKKRLLAIFAAVAMSLTTCFAFTACKDKEENVEPDNTITDNTENENETTENDGADGSVRTKQQWVAAIESSLTAKNYSSIYTYRVIYPNDSNTPYVPGSNEREYQVETKVDLENGFIIYEKRIDKGDFLGSIIDGKQVEEHHFGISEMYAELVGNDLIYYNNYFGNRTGYEIIEWDGENAIYGDVNVEEATGWTLTTNTNALDYWGSMENYLAWSGAPVTLLNKFIELYDGFKYDANTYTYYATGVAALKGSDVEISFRNGKVFKVVFDYEISDPDLGPYGICHEERTFSFGGVSITIPEEVKANAVEDID